MKKLITLSISLLLVTSLTFGEGNESKKQTSYSPNLKQLSIGVGTSSFGVPLSADLQFGVHKDMSIGPFLSYQTWNDSYYLNEWNYTITGFGGQFVYHFNRLLNIPENWDVYSSAILGYHSVKVKYNNQFVNSSSGSVSSGIGLWINIGGKYFFNDKFGAMLELGRTSLGGGARVGLAIKL